MTEANQVCEDLIFADLDPCRLQDLVRPDDFVWMGRLCLAKAAERRADNLPDVRVEQLLVLLGDSRGRQPLALPPSDLDSISACITAVWGPDGYARLWIVDARKDPNADPWADVDGKRCGLGHVDEIVGRRIKQGAVEATDAVAQAVDSAARRLLAAGWRSGMSAARAREMLARAKEIP